MEDEGQTIFTVTTRNRFSRLTDKGVIHLATECYAMEYEHGLDNSHIFIFEDPDMADEFSNLWNASLKNPTVPRRKTPKKKKPNQN